MIRTTAFLAFNLARRFSVMTRNALRHTLLASTFVSFLSSSPVLAQHEHATHAPAGARIGEVNFPTSCSPDMQRRFNQAVWTLHSFWYEESLKEFTAIAEAERLARAAKLANDAPTADDSYRQLVALSMKADTERPEVVEARQYLAH